MLWAPPVDTNQLTSSSLTSAPSDWPCIWEQMSSKMAMIPGGRCRERETDRQTDRKRQRGRERKKGTEGGRESGRKGGMRTQQNVEVHNWIVKLLRNAQVQLPSTCAVLYMVSITYMHMYVNWSYYRKRLVLCYVQIATWWKTSNQITFWIQSCSSLPCSQWARRQSCCWSIQLGSIWCPRWHTPLVQLWEWAQ